MRKSEALGNSHLEKPGGAEMHTLTSPVTLVHGLSQLSELVVGREWRHGRGAGNEKSVLEAEQTVCAWPLLHLGFTLKIGCEEIRNCCMGGTFAKVALLLSLCRE